MIVSVLRAVPYALQRRRMGSYVERASAATTESAELFLDAGDRYCIARLALKVRILDPRDGWLGVAFPFWPFDRVHASTPATGMRIRSGALGAIKLEGVGANNSVDVVLEWLWPRKSPYVCGFLAVPSMLPHVVFSPRSGQHESPQPYGFTTSYSDPGDLLAIADVSSAPHTLVRSRMNLPDAAVVSYPSRLELGPVASGTQLLLDHSLASAARSSAVCLIPDLLEEVLAILDVSRPANIVVAGRAPLPRHPDLDVSGVINLADFADEAEISFPLAFEIARQLAALPYSAQMRDAKARDMSSSLALAVGVLAAERVLGRQYDDSVTPVLRKRTSRSAFRDRVEQFAGRTLGRSGYQAGLALSLIDSHRESPGALAKVVRMLVAEGHSHPNNE